VEHVAPDIGGRGLSFRVCYSLVALSPGMFINRSAMSSSINESLSVTSLLHLSIGKLPYMKIVPHLIILRLIQGRALRISVSGR
jgi:hypothetical protein